MPNETTFYCTSTADYTECVESLDPFQDCSARLSTVAWLVARYEHAIVNARSYELPAHSEVSL